MVENHSLKKQAREIAERRGLTYTQALEYARAVNAYDIRKHMPESAFPLVRQAAEAAKSGRSVVVFGKTGVGKTSFLHAVMEKLQGIDRLYLFPHFVEAGMKTEDPKYKFKAYDAELPAAEQMRGYSVVTLDEMRSPASEEFQQAVQGKTLLIGSWGDRPEDAKQRLDYRLPGDWSNALVVHCEFFLAGHERSYSLYENFAVAQNSKYSPQDKQLREMAGTLLLSLEKGVPVAISEALSIAGEQHRTSPNMMKYALSYCHSKDYIEIDYDEATVTRLK